MMNPNNQTNVDDEMEDDNDEIGELYQWFWATETIPESLHKAVSDDYDRMFKPPFWKQWLCKPNLSGDLVFNWQIANALAICLVIGVVISSIPKNQVTQDQVTAFKGGTPTPNQDITKNPQQWLGKIADLVYEGKISLAEQELAKFKQQYPDYKAK